MSGLVDAPGAIVLAAYRPDPELFAVQLRSIQEQTVTNWRCLIGADGGQDDVRRLVQEFVGDDPRFDVVGWDDNVGLYLNIERLLQSLPSEAAWIALSDQDDRWYPDKLTRLLPLLDHAVLATGQARVTKWPGGDTLLPATRRRVVPLEDLLLENQVTGALTVMRREILRVALPFPTLHTVTQMHDHWLGMVAASTGGWVVLDHVVQDYVQHGSNLIGEGATQRTWAPQGVLDLVRDLADTYEGGHSLLRCLAAVNALGFGWRRLVVETLIDRVESIPENLTMSRDRLDLRSPARNALSLVVTALTSRNVSKRASAVLISGLPYELAQRWPRGRARHAHECPWTARPEISGTPLTFAVVLYRMAPHESLTLATLAESLGTSRSDRVVVLDNSPRSLATTYSRLPYLDRYVELPGNPGLATAYSLAAQEAEEFGSNWLVLLDQDTRVTRGYIAELRSATSFFDKTGGPVDAVAPGLMQSGRRLSPHGRVHVRGNPLKGGHIYARRWHAFNSGLALRLEAIVRVSGFPMQYPVDYLDHAMCSRLERTGSSLAVLTTSLEHQLAASNAKRLPQERLRSILESEQRFYLEAGEVSDLRWLFVRRIVRFVLVASGLRRTPSRTVEWHALVQAATLLRSRKT